MDLQAQFNLIVKQKDWWQAGEKVVIAVSTGVDSMTLLSLLMHLPVSERPKIIVAYVDHQLREQSVVETHFIHDYCQSHGLQLEQAVWLRGTHPKSGIEAAARTFRYNFFKKVLRETSSRYLLTAHHGDDLAETVLMKLVRGGQLSSLVGIPEAREFDEGMLLRPLLGFSKEQLRNFAVSKNIKWYEDVTNQELSVQRNRIRHEVVPMLKQENPKLLPHIHSYTAQLATVLTAVAELIEPIINSTVTVSDHQTVRIDLDSLKKHSPDVVQLAIQQVMERILHIPDVSINQVVSVLRLVDHDETPQGQLDFEDGWKVRREYQVLTILKQPQNFVGNPEKSRTFMVILDRWYSLNESFKFGVFSDEHLPNIGKKHDLYLADDDFPLSVRPVTVGDRISIGQGRHQKVGRVLINAKVPNPRRKQAQVLVTNRGTILAVLGVKNSAVPEDTANLRHWSLIEINENNISERKGISDE